MLDIELNELYNQTFETSWQILVINLFFEHYLDIWNTQDHNTLYSLSKRDTNVQHLVFSGNNNLWHNTTKC